MFEKNSKVWSITILIIKYNEMDQIVVANYTSLKKTGD